MGSTKRIIIRLSNERQMLLEKANEIVAKGPHDNPPTPDVIDVALTHLIESKENLEAARDHLDPTSVQQFNTSVPSLQYRQSVAVGAG